MKNNYDNHNDPNSLAKSHSKSSNAKLTLICLLACISLNATVAFAGLLGKFQEAYIYVGLGVSAVIFLLSLFLVSRFKR